MSLRKELLMLIACTNAAFVIDETTAADQATPPTETQPATVYSDEDWKAFHARMRYFVRKSARHIESNPKYEATTLDEWLDLHRKTMESWQGVAGDIDS